MTSASSPAFNVTLRPVVTFTAPFTTAVRFSGSSSYAITVKNVPKTSTSASLMRTRKGLSAFPATSKKASPDNSTSRSEPVNFGGYFSSEPASSHTLLPSAKTISFCAPPRGLTNVIESSLSRSALFPGFDPVCCTYKYAPVTTTTTAAADTPMFHHRFLNGLIQTNGTNPRSSLPVSSSSSRVSLDSFNFCSNCITHAAEGPPDNTHSSC